MPVITNPIVRLPCAAPSPDVQVRVVGMTAALAWYWHYEVQPLIDSNYQHAPQAVSAWTTRADVGWNWPQVRNLATLHSAARHVPGHSRALALSLVIDTDQEETFPIGMLTVVPRFQCSVFGAPGERGFAWYLADAPREVYRDLGIPKINNVAQALLDCGIQASTDAGLAGALLLHADPMGGTKLVQFYTAIGMAPLQPHGAPPGAHISTTRWATNGYFYFDDAAGQAFSRLHDPFR